ncbi:MAG: hypothetical protein RLY31_3139 [Bacteroidota bacterium]
MKINGERSVRSVRNEFRERFPFLHIVFLIPAAEAEGEGWKRVGPQKCLCQIRNRDVNGNIPLDPLQRPAALVRTFLEIFDLHVRILRRGADGWDAVGDDDDRSLLLHNLMGLKSQDCARII